MAKHRTKALFVWMIVVAVLLAIVFVITMVLTQNKFLYNTVNSVLGGEERYVKSGDPSEYMYYETEYENKEQVLAAANALNERIVGEGVVLLKNEESALPLSAGQKITVFGRNSVGIALGGSGSNKGDTSNAVDDVSDALIGAGFDCNTTIRDYYASVSGMERPEVSMGTRLTGYPVCEAPLPYPESVTGSYASFNDAAVVVLSRIGGEGYDLPRTMFRVGGSYDKWTADAGSRELVSGAASMDDHYLQLDKNEQDMLAEACENFDKVIVVVNSASSMELGFLDDPVYDGKIKAALWLGHTGATGLNALGDILSGEINPSGRTVDTHAADFTKDPSWHNFGNYLSEEGNRYYSANGARNAWFVEYREGIYVGYRYYETMCAEMNADSAGSGDAWYNENVVYPFGYGLSYSTFDISVEEPTDMTLTADSTVELSVKVKNNGPLAGKTVVQLYYTSPYTAGGIEKPHVVLADFFKTDELEVGEEKTYTLSVSARDMASYDYSDANGNGIKGYELEKGTYTLRVATDAHTYVGSYDYTLAEDVYYENSDAVEEEVKVENLFDDVSGHIEEYLSREDAFANASVLDGADSMENRTLSDEMVSSLTYVLSDKADDPWYSEHAPTQSRRSMSYKDTEVKLYDLIGKPYGDALWDKLLDQLTVTEMVDLVSTGNYRTVRIDGIGKPQTIDSDGPMGFAAYMGGGEVHDTCYYASEAVLGATWNRELAHEFGNMIGDEGLIGHKPGDGRTYSGWYAPAVNIHRSQFGGRNFEYYSEDGLLSGMMGAEVVRGANEKGVYTFVKHFALNEQETRRDDSGLVTWANEQAMRELYFLPFEYCVVEGGTTAMMSSFNRIGVTWAGGSYELLTRLLRDEWGFEGMVITDFNLKSYMNVDQMLRAGGDLNLSPRKGPSSTSTATDITVLRQATKNILYTIAQSNAMNGSGPNVIFGYTIPWWVVWLIVANCVILAGCAALAALYAVFTVRNKRSAENENQEDISNES